MLPTAGEISPQDIEQRAVAWLRHSVDCFDPLTYANADRMGRFAARKALAELAGLLLCRRRLGASTPGSDDAYAAMVDRLAEIAGHRSYRDLIARQPRSLWMFGAPYAALRAWGRDDAELRWMIEQAVAARHPVSWERLPYRHLDYLHFLDAGGVRHSLAPAAQVLPHTLLHATPNVADLEEDDVYAITHTVFYVTDYGRDPARWPASFDRESAAELVEALLAQHAAEGHSDLTAELLICAASLRVRDSGAAGAGWRLLAQLQSADGSIPSPRHLVARTYSGERDDGEYKQWKRCYHTTVVAALAVLCTAHAEAAPASTPPRNPAGAERGHGSPPTVERAVARALAWLHSQTEQAPPWRALIAAAGAAAGDVDSSDRDTTIVNVVTNTVAGLAGASSPTTLRSDDLSGPADLLALLAAALSLRDHGNRLSPTVERLISEAPHAPRLDLATVAHSNAGLDGGGVLALARVAIEGDGAAPIPEWSLRAVRAFRAYHLGDAAAMVSALVLAGAGARRTVRDVIEALLSQQRVDGSFGYAASDVEDERVATARVTWTARMVWALAGHQDPAAVRRVWAAATRIRGT